MTIQTGWAACPKCQGLFFGPFKGKCPAGGEHSQTHSFLYALSFDVAATDHLQTGWASCPKCQGMHFAGFPFKGICPAGGPHEQTKSFAYALKHGMPAAPFTQNGWRACPKCQGLFYGPFRGKCPADGREHSAQNSFDYSLEFLTRTVNPILHLIDRVNEVEVTGQDFTRDGPVEINYQYFMPGLDGVEHFRQGAAAATADGDGNFAGTFVPIPGDAFNIQAGGRDFTTGTKARDSEIIRPRVD